MEHQHIIQYIEQRLSLRKPQKDSLEVLDKVLDAVELKKNTDVQSQLSVVTQLFPTVTDFERPFMNLCFDLATGVGKTRLMGAFIAYLYKSHNIKNFLVIAPNLTVFKKLHADFTDTLSKKYVFRGIDVFSTNPPNIISGDEYKKGTQWLYSPVTINIFNVDLLTAKDGGDKKHLLEELKSIAKIRRMNENIGESYFEYLSSLDDMVVIMDEAHHYRSEQRASAISELNPVLGIELTATPIRVQTNNNRNNSNEDEAIEGDEKFLFRNIIYRYDLASAMRDKYVKEPCVATRDGFDIANYNYDNENPEVNELDKLKLRDGIIIHENTRDCLKDYHFKTNKPLIKPFMLVVAPDTEYANKIFDFITSQDFCNGDYANSEDHLKTILVHSKAKRGRVQDDDETVNQSLLEIEKTNNTVEIVIHVNMLSEGWDVTNLYTIVPLRRANSPILVEQSIGRGLRLPYGARTGESPVDRLTVISHEHYAEVIKRAKLGEGIWKTTTLGKNQGRSATKSDMKLQPLVEKAIPTGPIEGGDDTVSEINKIAGAIKRAADGGFAQGETKTISEYAATIVQNGMSKENVDKAVEQLKNLTFEIPDIRLIPKCSGFLSYKDFDLNTSEIPNEPIPNGLRITKILDDKKSVWLNEKGNKVSVKSACQGLLTKLVYYRSDSNYAGNEALFQKLVTQCCQYLQKTLQDIDVCNILEKRREEIAGIIYKQLKGHIVYEKEEYEYEITNGYVKLSVIECTMDQYETIRDYSKPLLPGEKDKIGGMIFSGFEKCLYSQVKFDSDAEREFACVLEKTQEVKKWFRPSYSNFSISFDNEGHKYHPDFLVETDEAKYICEVKADNQMDNQEVVRKMNAALEWCNAANQNAEKKAQLPWYYLLIPGSKIDKALTFGVACAKFQKN